MAITTTFTLVDNLSNKVTTMIGRINELIHTMNNLDNISDNTSNALSTVGQVSKNYNATMTQLNQQIVHVTNNYVQMNQQINNSNQSMSKINETTQKTEMSFSNMMQTVTGLYIAFKGLQSFFNFSDKIMNIDARLNLITNSEEEASKLKSSIMNVANNLGADFTEFSDQVIKIKQLTGDTFSSNGEALRFSELLSKSFKIAGTDAQQSSAALYQLTQALGSGALQGDEFRSIRENAPLLVDAIAKTMNVSKAELKKLGAEGKITADIIKTAVFSSAGEIENKFSQMPTTWGQMFNLVKNKLLIVSATFFKVFNSIAGNKVIMGMISDVMVLVGVFLTGASKILRGVLSTINVLEPFKYLVYGIVGAFVAYHGIVSLTNGVIKVHDFLVKGVKRALATWTIIQKILNGELTIMNALLNLNPIGLLIGAIIMFIAILQTGIAVFNKFTGSTKTLLGVIVGSVYAAFAIIENVAIGIVNLIIKGINQIIKSGATIAEAVYNMFVSPMNAIRNYVISVINFMLGGIKKLLSVSDKVVGTNLASSISKFQDTLEGKKVYTKGMVNWSQDTPKINELGYMSVSNAWNKGNKLGDNLQGKIGDFFGIKNGANDPTNSLLGDINSKLGNIDNNTEKGAEKTSEFVEDLKLLRDMAHREYISNVTSPNIHIEINNDNHINTDEDKEDFIQTLTNKVGLAIGSTAMKGVVG